MTAPLKRWVIFSLSIAFLWVIGVAHTTYAVESAAISSSPANNTLYVDVQTGSDANNNCRIPTAPCATLQRAVNQAQSGDTILVRTGTYTYVSPDNPCDMFLGGLKTVVCIINKQLTLRGGYGPGSWSAPNPAAYPTIIDGQHQTRGVYVLSSEPRQPANAGIDIEGFTVRRGYTKGTASGGDHTTFAFGGGMLTDYAYVSARNMIFEENLAIGGGEQNVYGGSGSGGALAIRRTPARAHLEQILFRKNRAEGGSGQTRGGYAVGGALYLFYAEADGTDLEFRDNIARSGSSTGFGRTPDGQKSDAFGGAASVMGYADVTFSKLRAFNNKAIAGNAATHAGDSFGGAIKAEGTPGMDLLGIGLNASVNLRMYDCVIAHNESLGGVGSEGGLAVGGGIETIHTNLLVERCRVEHNGAQGGNGSQLQGPAGGGGIYLQNIFYPQPAATIKNSLIASNWVAAGQGPAVGGGGSGVWLQGVEATLEHNTLVGNRTLTSPLQGSAILVMSDGTQGPRPAHIRYNIIADHTDSNASALHVKPGNTANLAHNLFHGNHSPVNQFEVGTITGMDSSVMADPHFVFEEPNVEGISYQIAATSPAVDRAIGSQESVDINNRPRRGVPDIGAYEARPFQVQVFPTGSGELTVYWGLHPGVTGYQLTIGCPNTQVSTQEFQCWDQVNYSGSVSGAVLGGLDNYRFYDIVVVAVGGDGEPLMTSSREAMPTDIFLFAPAILR